MATLRYVWNCISRGRRDVPAIDFAIASAALLINMLAGLLIARGGVLFTRPLWLDEYHTLLVANRDTLREGIRVLALGADFNPPLLYLIMHGVGRVAGFSPLSMRMVAFASVWLASVVTYASLRRFLPFGSALGGALAVWSSFVVVDQAFQARFYGPWLLLCCVLIWSIGIHRDRERSRYRDVAIALSSIGVCTIHYFGIFSVILIAGGAAFSLRRSGTRLRRIAPILAGPCALLLCAPLYLGQRASLTVRTWIAPQGLGDLIAMTREILLRPALVLVVFTGFMVTVLRRPNAIIRSWPPEFAAMLGLGLMPLVIFGFSVAVQPSLVDRYLIVAVLAWCPFVGIAYSRVGRPLKVALAVLMLAFSARMVNFRASWARVDAARMAAEAAAVAPFLRDGSSVVVLSRHTLYPLAHSSDSGDLRFLDISDTTFQRMDSTLSLGDPTSGRKNYPDILERDVARVHHRLFDFPKLAHMPTDESLSRTVFFVPAGVWPANVAELLFPGREIDRPAPDFFILRGKP